MSLPPWVIALIAAAALAAPVAAYAVLCAISGAGPLDRQLAAHEREERHRSNDDGSAP